MHTNWCVLVEKSMEIGMLNFWLGLLVTALTKESYFSANSWLPRMCRSCYLFIKNQRHCLIFPLLLWTRLYLFLFPFWISEQKIESGNTDCTSSCGQSLQTIMTNICVCSAHGKQCLLIEEIKTCKGRCIFLALFISFVLLFIISTSVLVIMLLR